MNRYCIEIVAESPPQVCIGNKLAGGEIVAIRSDEPDYVSTTWLANKTGLSKSTISEKLKSIAKGTGKFTYPRILALKMLDDGTPKRGRPRKN